METFLNFVAHTRQFEYKNSKAEWKVKSFRAICFIGRLNGLELAPFKWNSLLNWIFFISLKNLSDELHLMKILKGSTFVLIKIS